jgi:hypothetical protein
MKYIAPSQEPGGRSHRVLNNAIHYQSLCHFQFQAAISGRTSSLIYSSMSEWLQWLGSTRQFHSLLTSPSHPVIVYGFSVREILRIDDGSCLQFFLFFVPGITAGPVCDETE